MYELIVENERGDQLSLTNCTVCNVLRIDGLNPSSATINTSVVAGVDGSKYNSSRINEKNIVLLLRVKQPIEYNRQQLYKYFRAKRWCRLYFKNDNRNVYIDGYVETFENDHFTMSQQPQISIICPQPFFKNVDNNITHFSMKVPAFQFPFSIADEGVPFGTLNVITLTSIDAGEVETGAIITFAAKTDQVLNPKIYNRTTQAYFGLDFDMNQGDVITINTSFGKKSVTLLRDGATSNIINSLSQGSKWIQFVPGENDVSYGADEGQSDLSVSIELTPMFEGV